jgi:hypothetical protein
VLGVRTQNFLIRAARGSGKRGIVTNAKFLSTAERGSGPSGSDTNAYFINYSRAW